MTRKTKAILLIAGGPILVVGVLVLFAITSFALGGTPDTGSDLAATIGTLVNVILSIVGIIGLLLIMIGIPLGIVFLVTAKDEGGSEEGPVFHSLQGLTKNIVTIGMITVVLSLLQVGLMVTGIYWAAVLGLISMPLSFVLLITYLIWIYRAAANILAKKKGKLTVSPGWAVGMHFIPMLNLIFPGLLLRQIWAASVEKKTSYWVLIIWFGSVVLLGLLNYFDPSVNALGGFLFNLLFTLLFLVGLWFMHRVSEEQEKWK